MFSCGIDIGSVSTESVIVEANDDDIKIAGYDIRPTGASSKDAALLSFERSLDKAGIEKDEVKRIVSTGYGRANVPFADKNITEISCHAKGVLAKFKDIRTIIDIGGQDSKVIKIDETGVPIDFLMNDKCAAGTGRFLEVMSRAMEIDIKEFADIFLNNSGAVNISSTCTVFAESEIVSLIGQGVDRAKIVRGLIYSIVSRIVSMVERVGLEEPVSLTGGVAKNLAVVKGLEERLDTKLLIPDEPQITGALGAAIFALKD
jgi:predicted CoA-substrate-specific enzyme activase